MFHCEDCIHYKDGECDIGRELCEDDEDAYDCTRFEDANPV